MGRYSSWHAIAIGTIPLGIWLSVQFGMLGLAAYSILCLIIGYNCPDTVLFQKPPDNVNRHTGKQYYKGVSSGALMMFMLFVISIIMGAIVWMFSPQDIAEFISRFGWAAIVNDNTLITINYLAYGSADGFEISDKTYEKLDNMREYYPKFALYAVISRLVNYIWLPILVAISVFDHARMNRNGYNFSKFRQEPSASQLKILAGICILISFICWVDYLSASPFILADIPRGQLGLIVGQFATVILWMMCLMGAAAIIAKPQTWSMDHTWDHGPFPAAKFDTSRMPHERGR